jgi:hypothetical protein
MARLRRVLVEQATQPAPRGERDAGRGGGAQAGATGGVAHPRRDRQARAVGQPHAKSVGPPPAADQRQLLAVVRMPRIVNPHGLTGYVGIISTIRASGDQRGCFSTR